MSETPERRVLTNPESAPARRPKLTKTPMTSRQALATLLTDEAVERDGQRSFGADADAFSAMLGADRTVENAADPFWQKNTMGEMETPGW